jgi:hypothetical protein
VEREKLDAVRQKAEAAAARDLAVREARLTQRRQDLQRQKVSRSPLKKKQGGKIGEKAGKKTG